MKLLLYKFIRNTISTSPETLLVIEDCLSMVPNITFRRMMGEYCVYSRRSISWLVCDNTLFLKTTTDTINLFEDQISYKKMSWYKEVAPAFVGIKVNTFDGNCLTLEVNPFVINQSGVYSYTH